MVTESVLNDNDEIAHCLLPPPLFIRSGDEIVDSLVDALRATMAHQDRQFQELAEAALAQVRQIQKDIKQQLAIEQGESSIIPLADIVRYVESQFRFEPGTLCGRSKMQRITTARQIAYWLCREITGSSFPQIGESLRRDHSSVIWGVNLVQRRMDREPGFKSFIEKLETTIVAAIPPPREAGAAAHTPAPAAVAMEVADGIRNRFRDRRDIGGAGENLLRPQEVTEVAA